MPSFYLVLFYFFISIGILLTGSCGAEEAPSAELLLTPVDEYVIPDPRLNEKSHRSTAQDRTDPARIAIYDPNAHAILIADLPTRSITHTIPLLAEGPEGFGPVRAMSFIGESKLPGGLMY